MSATLSRAPSAQFTQRQIAILVAIEEEWDRAEQDIKLAERVCNEIVFPSINELRYSGRRLVDVIHGILNGASDEEIESWAAEAKSDCHRARYDAIDAAISKIAVTVDTMVANLRYEAILPAFPEFPALVRILGELRTKLARSHPNRENREALYATIEATDVPELIEIYQRLLQSVPIMKKIALKNRWSDFVALGSLAVAAAAIAIAFH